MVKINDIICIEGLGNDSNSYVINNEILVDTGTGSNQDFLHEKLKENKINPDDISLIVNTHCHFDHVGGNYLFPKAKVAIHEADAQTLKDNYNKDTAIELFQDKIKRHDVDIELKSGDKIANFEVIHTPGHTPGGICLFDGENLISGDTIFANGGIGRMDIGGNVEDMKSSLNKLNALNVKYLLPGHGSWTDNANRHIDISASSLI
ncbi:MBL fold metallo-hydrolase [Methanobrevibacter sp. DSM 116169]|uniref:MBL fold metallo-hydrolase n=1 Tax=Methanobrevibacter sp. DSM 116169 TaxID=3242727 RepID=UPI0038FC8FA7